MHIFVVGAHAEDAADEGFDLELGYTTINTPDSYTEADMPQHQEKPVRILSEHHHSKKYQTGKHISVQLYLKLEPVRSLLSVHEPVAHTPAMYPAYRYLYFREINPPPPKNC